MPIPPFCPAASRPVAVAAGFTGLLWPMLRALAHRSGCSLARRRQARVDRRLHSSAINSLQGLSPEMLRDIGAAPELIAELRAAEEIRQGALGRPQHW